MNEEEGEEVVENKFCSLIVIDCWVVGIAGIEAEYGPISASSTHRFDFDAVPVDHHLLVILAATLRLRLSLQSLHAAPPPLALHQAHKYRYSI